MALNWKNKKDSFNKRWNIAETIDSSIIFLQFRTRILNIFNDIDKHVYSDGVKIFCQYFSIIYDENHHGYIRGALISVSNIVDLYEMLEVIFALDIYDNSHYIAAEYKDKRWYLREAKEVFEISNLETRIVETKEHEILIIPDREEKLDKELVDLALSFLDENSNSHFLSALKFYEQKRWVKCSESIRRSLEEYLRNKLKNEVGLKENISNLGKILKKENSSVQIRNIIITIFSYLDSFFNENSKHKDGDLDESDAEFLIYQTALLMRYIEKYVES